MRDTLHEITDASSREQEDGQAEAARRGRKPTNRIAQVLQLLPSDTMENYFETLDHNAIWEELHTSEEYRGRVIE
jgi:hypothetical protein